MNYKLKGYILPWLHLHGNTTGNYELCCMSKLDLDNLDINLLKEFKKYTQNLDKIRKENFIEIFSEHAEWYNDIKL